MDDQHSRPAAVKSAGLPAGTSTWNHNLHYHRLIRQAAMQGGSRALDAGCGEGRLTRELAERFGEMVGIDQDAGSLAQARGYPIPPNVTFLQGDLMRHPFPPAHFPFITAVATLHHLPLGPALTRFKDLLAPGGTLALLGLYRNDTLVDYLFAAAGRAASTFHRFSHSYSEVQAPRQPPGETLIQIRTAAAAILPGCLLERRLLFRYTLFWRKAPMSA